jgi:hypothetical protein
MLVAINLHRFCYLEVTCILSSFPNKVWVKLAGITEVSCTNKLDAMHAMKAYGEAGV